MLLRDGARRASASRCSNLLSDTFSIPGSMLGTLSARRRLSSRKFGMVEETPMNVIHDLFAERNRLSIRWVVDLGDRKIVQAFDLGTPACMTSGRSTAPSASRSPPPSSSPRAVGGPAGKPFRRLPAAQDAADGRSRLFCDDEPRHLIERPARTGIHFVLGDGASSRNARPLLKEAEPWASPRTAPIPVNPAWKVLLGSRLASVPAAPPP